MGDDLRFVVFVQTLREDGLLALAALAPEVFYVAPSILLDDGVCQVEDAHGAAVVLFQADGLHVRVVLFKLEDVAHGGASEAVDGLVVIAHHAEVVMLRDDEADDLKLHHVGILILVDHHVLKPLAVFGAHFGVALEELGGVIEDVVKIHGLVEEQSLLVERVDLVEGFVEGI